MLISCINATVWFCIWFIELANIPRYHKFLRRKPFNCEVCLPFYVFVILHFLPIEAVDVIGAVFFSIFAVSTVIKLMAKWHL